MIINWMLMCKIKYFHIVWKHFTMFSVIIFMTYDLLTCSVYSDCVNRKHNTIATAFLIVCYIEF